MAASPDAPNRQAKPGDHGALRRLFVVFTLFMIGAYLAALLQNWRDTYRHTETSLTHINNMLVQGVRATMQANELVLLGLGGELVARGALADPGKGRALIDRTKATAPGVAGFGLARPDGQLVLVSNVAIGTPLPNLAEQPETRDSFLQAIAQNRIQLGRPYFMEALGRWVSPIRVPIHDANGALVAVMTAGHVIEPGAASWTHLALPPKVEIALLRDDGYVQHFHPLVDVTLEQAYGQPAHPDSLRQIRQLPGNAGFVPMVLPRRHGPSYVAYERVAEFGLLAGAFVPRSAVVAQWLESAIAPTLLLSVYLLGSLWAYRRFAAQQQQASQEVAKLTDWQQAVLDSADYSIISTNTDGVIVSFNAAAQRMLGYRADEVIGKLTPAVIHDADEVARRATELSEELGRPIAPGFEVFVAKSRLGKAEEREWTYIRKDGSRFPVRLSVTPLHDQAGAITGFLGIADDLTESKQTQSRLRDSDARYRALFECAGDSIFLMDGERFTDCNPAALQMFGCTREQIVGQPPSRLFPARQPDGRASVDKARELIGAALRGESLTFEWQHCRFDGTPFDTEVTLNAVEIAGTPHLLANIRDISERKESRARLEYLAHHDSLTGLLNRHALHLQAGRALDLDAAPGGRHALMLIDLDRFKEINDTLGHHIGDRILQAIGPLIEATLDQRQAVISRLGGDEFAVFLANIDDADALKQVSGAILEAIKQPLEVDAMKLEIDASIGVARFPQDGDNSHQLLRSADVAMYEAKSRGGGIAFYDPATDQHSPERLTIMADLGNAIRENQLCLHYQPKFDLRQQRITGFEALVRWQHPALGLLSPDRFIPLAEVSDVIHALTLSVLHQALDQQRQWKAEGHRFTVAVNMSARNLIDDRCVEAIQALLPQFGTQPGELELEITETALMHDPEGAAARLARLAALGVKLSIDDFGTGFSSLGYLRRLPIHALKIDRLFVKDMRANEQDASIVRSTIGLAHNLNLLVVAEGVESAEVQALLQQMGCDQIQGFHLSRPRAWPNIRQWLAGAPSGVDGSQPDSAAGT